MSSFLELRNRIREKKSEITIVGLGYVGLPLALHLVSLGYKVNGYDNCQSKIEKLNKGQSYISTVENEEIKNYLFKGLLSFSNKPDSIQNSDVVCVCVPTPLKEGNPDTSYLELATADIVSQLGNDGKLIVIESSIFPGVTRNLFSKYPHLNLGEDIFICHAPERIDPGNNYSISDIPRVVGGITERCLKLGNEFCKQIHKNTITVSSVEVAELTKLIENSYRAVNISLINEISLVAEKANIDILESINAASTKPYGFMPFWPSSGFGGHCIPIDPVYLLHWAKQNNCKIPTLEQSMLTNNKMPIELFLKLKEILNEKPKELLQSYKILVVGVSYKPNVNDTRNSSAIEFIKECLLDEIEVDYYDPLVSELSLFKGVKLKSIELKEDTVVNYDSIVIICPHDNIDYDIIRNSNVTILDSRFRSTIGSTRYYTNNNFEQIIK